MTGRRKHPIWIHFDEKTEEGKTKRAICKDCKLSIVALVERMIKHKVLCTSNNNNNRIILQHSGIDESGLENIATDNSTCYETGSLDFNFNNANENENLSMTSPLKRSYVQSFETLGTITNVEKENLIIQLIRILFTTDSKIVKHPDLKTLTKMLQPKGKSPNRFKVTKTCQTYDKCSRLTTHNLQGKTVCMSISGWSKVHKDSSIRVSVYDIDKQTVHLIDIIDLKDELPTAQYFCDLAMKSICKCNVYGCKVTSIVTDCTVNIHQVRENFATHSDLKNILTYSCNSHVLNLLSIDVQTPNLVDHLKTVIKYFKNTDFVEVKYKVEGGKDLNLPLNEMVISQLVDMVESYIQNWQIILKVCNENKATLDSEIIDRVNDINLKDDAYDFLVRLKKISAALVKSQNDTCTIGGITEIWLDLMNQFKSEDDDLKIKIKERFEMAITPAHYLANILDPRFEGKKLLKNQYDKGLEYMKALYPEVIPHFLEYQAHSGPFEDFLFTAAINGYKDVKPFVWWKSLEKSGRNQISDQMFMLNRKLHSAVASSSGIEHLLSTSFKQADTDNQHFQWGHTSEDSYAEGNDANATGYEADSVLASMMHESMDDYHNQEPIVDVQERQTWSSCRKYRNMPLGTDGDYSDEDGRGICGNSRKMMRMSRPDTLSDEFSMFADYVAERMRNLKPDKALQLMARRDIEQVLFKYEMKLLEQRRDSQQQQQPDTEAATTSKSISPSPISDLEQQ